MAHNTLSIFLTLLLSITLIGCTQSGPSDDIALGSHGGFEADAAAGEMMYLTVHGMSCPLCATNIDKQLLRVPGVEAVSVNLGTGVVALRIDASNPPDVDAIKRAVDESGFTLAKGPWTK